jgi:hypothetical protein
MAEEKPKSVFIQEMERRTNDLLRVYNPIEKDFVVKWDKKNGTKLFRVPAKTESVHIRYIAEKYVREMYQQIITERTDKAVIEENERRVAKGFAEMLKYKEQQPFESRFYNPTDEDAKKIISILYVGIENEFGVDREAPPDESGVREEKPVFNRALESVMEEKKTSVPTPQEPTTPPLTEVPDRQKTEDGFKCDHPGCDFTTKTRVALFGHKRSHQKEIDTLEEKKQSAVSGISASTV